MKEYTWITQYIYPFVLLTVEGVKHCWTLYMLGCFCILVYKSYRHDGKRPSSLNFAYSLSIGFI